MPTQEIRQRVTTSKPFEQQMATKKLHSQSLEIGGLKSGEIWKIILFAFAFRCLVLVWIYFTDWMVKDYDSSSYVQHFRNGTVIDYGKTNRFYGKGFAHWDSVFFLRIAKMGFYEFESFFAFFPLYPFSVRMLTLYFVNPIGELIGVGTSDMNFMWSGVLISNMCFLISVFIFIWLTELLFKGQDNFVKISALVYIINPATIFMSVW